eukprot:gnl/TRDRNA2_/TRDRNA2_144652_c0_seq2.p1 gnl/TRDRNA2_/TRDRNA2_144652_c0~~gnl/TRDRNA2_/TRDRNA2_144652_c0_seq2.p1  ORF type:complete len:721 (+),score=172.49 gnl/TRDRNA2_/TRDRNA2_144652_c0_seq2:50-2212(+)
MAEATKKQFEWDQQVAVVDAKMSEVFQSQWKVVREQISSLARELVSIRSDCQSLRAADAQLLKGLEAEQERRQDLVAIWEASLKATEERIQLEISDRCESARHRALQELASTRERLASTLKEQSAKHESLEQAFEHERGVRASGDEGARSRLEQMAATLDDDRASRNNACESLERDLSRLRLELEAESGQRERLAEQLKRLHADLAREVAGRATGSAEMDQSLAALRLALEQEARLRKAGHDEIHEALQSEVQERSDRDAAAARSLSAASKQLEGALEDQKAALRDVVESTRKTGNELVHKVHKDILEKVEEEGRARTAGNDSQRRALKEDLESFRRDLRELREQDLRDMEAHRQRQRGDFQTALADLRSAVDHEEALRRASHDSLQDLLKAEAAKREESDTAAERGLATAVKLLEAEDARLHKLLDVEKAARADALDELKSQLDAESGLRVTGDDILRRALRELVTPEAFALELQKVRDEWPRALESEAAARVADDDALRDVLGSGLKSGLTALQEALDSQREMLQSEQAYRKQLVEEVRKLQRDVAHHVEALSEARDSCIEAMDMSLKEIAVARDRSDKALATTLHAGLEDARNLLKAEARQTQLRGEALLEALGMERFQRAQDEEAGQKALLQKLLEELAARPSIVDTHIPSHSASNASLSGDARWATPISASRTASPARIASPSRRWPSPIRGAGDVMWTPKPSTSTRRARPWTIA